MPPYMFNNLHFNDYFHCFDQSVSKRYGPNFVEPNNGLEAATTTTEKCQYHSIRMCPHLAHLHHYQHERIIALVFLK